MMLSSLWSQQTLIAAATDPKSMTTTALCFEMQRRRFHAGEISLTCCRTIFGGPKRGSLFGARQCTHYRVVHLVWDLAWLTLICFFWLIQNPRQRWHLFVTKCSGIDLLQGKLVSRAAVVSFEVRYKRVLSMLGIVHTLKGYSFSMRFSWIDFYLQIQNPWQPGGLFVSKYSGGDFMPEKLASHAAAQSLEVQNNVILLMFDNVHTTGLFFQSETSLDWLLGSFILSVRFSLGFRDTPFYSQ